MSRINLIKAELTFVVRVIRGRVLFLDRDFSLH